MVFGRVVSVFLDTSQASFKIEHLKISFEVTYERSRPYQAIISIYNLSLENEKLYLKEGTQIRLLAGYSQGYGSGFIFDGAIIGIERLVESPDIKTRFTCLSHIDLTIQEISLNSSQVDTHSLIEMLCSHTSYQIDKSSLPNKFYPNFSVKDTPLSILRKLAHDVGYQVEFTSGRSISFQSFESSLSLAKFKITQEVLQSPVNKIQENGYYKLNFETLLNYQFSLNSSLQLSLEEYKGTYSLDRLIFQGDNTDGDFKCVIDLNLREKSLGDSFKHSSYEGY